jgi:hypothetical protein
MKYPKLLSTTAWFKTAQMKTSQLMLISTAASAANATRRGFFSASRMSFHCPSHVTQMQRVNKDHRIRWQMISKGSTCFKNFQ